MRFCFAILGLLCLASVVNASAANAATRRRAQKTATMSPSEFISYMLKNADDATIPDGHDAKFFGLPTEGDSIPIKGDSTDPGEIGNHKQSSCEVILERKGGALKPHCLLIVVDDDRPKERRTHGREYKFDLDGRLVSAIDVEGELNERGEAIEGSGTAPKPLDVSNPVILKNARQEIDFWLERTAKRLAKQKKSQKKVTSGGRTGTPPAAIAR